MAEDWAIDVRKYAPDADSAVIAAIVRYCGIALRSRDASLVSFTDPVETDRVRENFLKKKLGLTDPDTVLDGAITAVGQRMSGDSTRNRVTVYYLLAEHFGKLGLFGASTDLADDPVAAAPLPLMAAAKREEHRKPAGVVVEESGWMEYLPIAVLLLGGAALFALIIGNKPMPPAPAPVAVVAPAPEIPAGAGVVETVVDGEPMVSIYFDTAKFEINPDFEARTAALRAWLAGHPGTHLRLSGYNDPRGDAAFNAELSKNRAFAVRDRLAALGVPVTSMDLVKPADSTDTIDSYAVARRVDVTVEDGPVPAGEAAIEPSPAAVAAEAPPAP